MRYVSGFVRFWYDFIVGDDWRVAAAVIASLALTALLVHTRIAWVVVPLAVLVFLGVSLHRAAKPK
ncbi:hypothetical protein [Deinococcus ruber]|uniref:Uncharacterized protein n=1 Tax=Deinococcus ruber TaxID=1848197 RepID=A0A918FFR8_9DEIO|nr:hypothetical protein [Deinococcus ruber]GGR35262.1 hypothetical protein GCM10008957_51560 [Deinococcus ruber]